jgi:hypothetical protein
MIDENLTRNGLQMLVDVEEMLENAKATQN